MMTEFDERNYVPEEYMNFRNEPSSNTFHKHAKVTGGIYESHPELFENKSRALPEIVRVSAPKEAEGLLLSNGNVIAMYADVLEHDKLESRKISKYPEPDKYEIHADGLPVGFTNNGEIDLDKLKEVLIN